VSPWNSKPLQPEVRNEALTTGMSYIAAGRIRPTLEIEIEKHNTEISNKLS
jgi:hypothetical protein